jgi:hypothetical protein
MSALPESNWSPKWTRGLAVARIRTSQEIALFNFLLALYPNKDLTKLPAQRAAGPVTIFCRRMKSATAIHVDESTREASN